VALRSPLSWECCHKFPLRRDQIYPAMEDAVRAPR
jgi:hypothetical protein